MVLVAHVMFLTRATQSKDVGAFLCKSQEAIGVRDIQSRDVGARVCNKGPNLHSIVILRQWEAELKCVALHISCWELISESGFVVMEFFLCYLCVSSSSLLFFL